MVSEQVIQDLEEMSRISGAASITGNGGAVGEDAEASRSAKVTGESSITVNLPILIKLNYPLRSKRMQLYLEANGLWDAVRSETIIGAVP